MTVTTMFHLGVNKEQLQGATLAIIPGDPARVAKIAEQLDEPVFLNTHREFTLYLGKINGQSVVVCSTGIGGPSTSIAVEELAQLGVTSFLRVGTTGAIQPDIAIGDMIVTTAAVRLDGASHHFAPVEFPAVADFEMVSAIKQAALNDGLTVRLGITASSDTFYPGQERYDTVTGRVLSTFQGSMKQWQEMGVLNYEMESATLFTQCASSGLQAACVAGVLINRCNLQEIPSHETAVAVEAATISLAVRAATIWLNAR